MNGCNWQKKKFSVFMSSKKYNENYSRIFVKSKCCNANVKTRGLPDFFGDKYICTVYYVCQKCGKACDIK